MTELLDQEVQRLPDPAVEIQSAGREEAGDQKKKKRKRKRGHAETDVEGAQLAPDVIQESLVAPALVECAGSPVGSTIAAAANGIDVDSWGALEACLRKGGASLDAVEIRSDPISGLGAFAKRDIAVGEVAFTVPIGVMLTSDLAVKDKLVEHVSRSLKKSGQKDMPEFLMCLRLCRARSCVDDALHAYASSLPSTAPGAASWPAAFRDFLSTTSLGPSLAAADAELDGWEALLERVSKASPGFLQPRDAFKRPFLEWARGMLQSRQFPGGFGGQDTTTALCMVPLLDILNHNPSADVTVRISSGTLEFICDEGVKAGQQIWNNYGSKGNDELLMCYGFAINDNRSDAIQMAMKSDADETTSALMLTPEGVPEELIEAIEVEQDTAQFIALLRAVLLRRRAVKECLGRVSSALNFTVCKGVLPRSRKRSIEAFLEGQLKILELCMEQMQPVDTSGKDVNEAAHEENEEELDEEEEDAEREEDKETVEEELTTRRPQKKRRR